MFCDNDCVKVVMGPNIAFKVHVAMISTIYRQILRHSIVVLKSNMTHIGMSQSPPYSNLAVCAQDFQVPFFSELLQNPIVCTVNFALVFFGFNCAASTKQPH